MKTKAIILIVVVVIAGLGLAFLLIRAPRKPVGTEHSGPGRSSSDLAQSGPDSAVNKPDGIEEATASVQMARKEPDPPTTATAQITRGDGRQVELRSIDHEYERLLVDPNEVIKIRVVLKECRAESPILVEADNGGSLNRQIGPLALQPAAQDGAIEFEYSIGGNPGKYTLFFSQGVRQEFMEFWAGPEMPVGQAGPPREFRSE